MNCFNLFPIVLGMCTLRRCILLKCDLYCFLFTNIVSLSLILLSLHLNHYTNSTTEHCSCERFLRLFYFDLWTNKQTKKDFSDQCAVVSLWHTQSVNIGFMKRYESHIINEERFIRVLRCLTSCNFYSS